MHGFQLWANLPSALKMTGPRYQDIQGSDITEVVDDDGTVVKIIIGSFRGKQRPGGRDRGGAALSRRDGAGGGAQDPAGGYPRQRLRLCLRRRSAAFSDAAAPVGVRVEKEYRGEELNIRDLSGQPHPGAFRRAATR